MKIIPHLIILIVSIANYSSYSQEKLEVEGAITLKNSEAIDPTPGTIRFNPATNDFEGWNGFFWASLTGHQFETGEVTDIDGNRYQTVIIGTQEWMVQDLRTAKYGNGNDIQQVTENTDWENANYGAWCWYDNDNSHEQPYGKLYNWYAVHDGRGLCPTGWHVPGDAEWTTLTNYLGGADIAGGKMKEAGTTHWMSPNTGATNESGFTALPAGNRTTTGLFFNLGSYVNWWSSTESSSSDAWYRSINYVNLPVYRNFIDKRLGSSVRCVRD
jgi:uncharacterized protein (TIGR02145 family)